MMNEGQHTAEPTRIETALVVLLRVAGVLLMSALVPAVMPFSWMNTIHQALGLGTLPDLPITGYLTRSLSLMYAVHGAIVFYVAGDVRRYREIIHFLAVLGILFGAGMLSLDIAVGMPLSWTLGEGPFVVILGAAILTLCNRIPAPPVTTEG